MQKSKPKQLAKAGLLKKASWNTAKVSFQKLGQVDPTLRILNQRKKIVTWTQKIFEINAMRAAGIPSAKIEAKYSEQQLEAADKTRRQGLTELIEAASGVPLGRYPRDAQGQKTWLQAAFSSMSLPGILGNVANKLLWEGYNSVDQSWREIAKVSSVSDFKESERYRLTEAMKFEQVAP